jgi:hypothetical protein
MPRLTKEQWENVRAEREAGASYGDLAAKHGVSKAAILKRARKEEWRDDEDIQQIIRDRAAAKVNAVVTTGNPEKRAQALDEAAERTAEVISRHREETNAIRDRLYAGLKAHKRAEDRAAKQLAFEDLKAAKISSECLLNIHKAERQAWSIDDRPAEHAPQVSFYLPTNGR